MVTGVQQCSILVHRVVLAAATDECTTVWESLSLSCLEQLLLPLHLSVCHSLSALLCSPASPCSPAPPPPLFQQTLGRPPSGSLVIFSSFSTRTFLHFLSFSVSSHQMLQNIGEVVSEKIIFKRWWTLQCSISCSGGPHVDDPSLAREATHGYWWSRKTMQTVRYNSLIIITSSIALYCMFFSNWWE